MEGWPYFITLVFGRGRDAVRVGEETGVTRASRARVVAAWAISVLLLCPPLLLLLRGAIPRVLPPRPHFFRLSFIWSRGSDCLKTCSDYVLSGLSCRTGWLFLRLSVSVTDSVSVSPARTTVPARTHAHTHTHTTYSLSLSLSHTHTHDTHKGTLICAHIHTHAHTPDMDMDMDTHTHTY